MNASEQITTYIDGLGDWRGKTLARLRKLIRDAAPVLSEEWKWNTPVWSHNGNVLFKGASLDDSHGVLNAGLEAKASRAIDIHERDRINEAAFKDLVRAAVDLNGGKPKSKTPRK